MRTGMVFPGVQTSTWTYDREARTYYHHRFYTFQPDLNTENPAVQEEIRTIMGLWLQLGVSAHALRLSAGVARLSPVTYGRHHPVGGGEYLAGREPEVLRSRRGSNAHDPEFPGEPNDVLCFWFRVGPLLDVITREPR